MMSVRNPSLGREGQGKPAPLAAGDPSAAPRVSFSGESAMSQEEPDLAASTTAAHPNLDQDAFAAGHRRDVPRLIVHPFGFVASLLCFAWLVAAAVLLTRLAGAWRQLSQLRASAVEADRATVGMCREVASLMGVAAPGVKHNPYLPSPCLAGLRRPVVLLPEASLGPAIRDVLIHELAHLRRRDCHWNLLRRLATAVFSFQPLLW